MVNVDGSNRTDCRGGLLDKRQVKETGQAPVLHYAAVQDGNGLQCSNFFYAGCSPGLRVQTLCSICSLVVPRTAQRSELGLDTLGL